VLQIGEHVRMAIQYFASSVLIRTCANFCTGSLGTHPKPRDRTSCELRVFVKTLLGSRAKITKGKGAGFEKMTFPENQQEELDM
ncbi:MAG: hypothetical protein ILP14_07865, partial [Oscillospiraceae bacterium]|nr:hypothetical protein [Oscillospiraceae bacterium]